MLKVVSINRFEGNGIIERIKGNGWDIDANRIELNGINAQIIDDPENRIISLNGPAVEDLFKSLRDLLRENSKLRENIDDAQIENHELRGVIDDMKKENIGVSHYFDNIENSSETLHLRQTIDEQDECIKHLENGLKEKNAAIKVLRFDKDHYKESCEILKRSIEEKNDHINMLDKLLGDKDAEIDELKNKLKKYDNTQTLLVQHNNEKRARIRTLEKELKDKDDEIDKLNDKLKKYEHTQIPSIVRHNNELLDKCNFLDNILPLAVKMNPILNFIKETRDNNIDYAKKKLSHFMPGYDVIVTVSRQEDDDNG